MKLLNLLLTYASSKENEKKKNQTPTLSHAERKEKKKLGLKSGWKGCGYTGGVSGIDELIYKQGQLCWRRNFAEALSAAAFSLTPLFL